MGCKRGDGLHSFTDLISSYVRSVDELTTKYKIDTLIPTIVHYLFWSFFFDRKKTYLQLILFCDNIGYSFYNEKFQLEGLKIETLTAMIKEFRHHRHLRNIFKI